MATDMSDSVPPVAHAAVLGLFGVACTLATHLRAKTRYVAALLASLVLSVFQHICSETRRLTVTIACMWMIRWRKEAFRRHLLGNPSVTSDAYRRAAHSKLFEMDVFEAQAAVSAASAPAAANALRFDLTPPALRRLGEELQAVDAAVRDGVARLQQGGRRTWENTIQPLADFDR